MLVTSINEPKVGLFDVVGMYFEENDQIVWYFGRV
jgi:hypothetical protein